MPQRARDRNTQRVIPEEKQDKKAKVPHAVKGRSSETTKANTSDKSKNVKPEKQKERHDFIFTIHSE